VLLLSSLGNIILTFAFLVSESISFVLSTNDDIWECTWHLTISSFKTCKHFIKRSTLIINYTRKPVLNYHYFSIKVRRVTQALEDVTPSSNIMSRLKSEMSQNLKSYGEITRWAKRSFECNNKKNLRQLLKRIQDDAPAQQ